MLINEIRFKLKKKKRIGRGGKRGNYSGRGMKGQKARAGRKIRPAICDFILRLPQKRGKGNITVPREKPFVINLYLINEKFSDEENVNMNSLIEKKLVKIPKHKRNKVKIKILGNGELTKKLIFSSDLLFSQKAREKILNSGSRIE